jgi:hypothetical protein
VDVADWDEYPVVEWDIDAVYRFLIHSQVRNEYAQYGNGLQERGSTE